MSVFSSKLDRLIETVELGVRADIGDLAEAFRASSRKLVFAVGSGGATVGAEYVAMCRNTLQAAPTFVCTPLEFALNTQDLGGAEVWLFSANGKNPDIMAAFDSATTRQASVVHVLTVNEQCLFIREAERLANVHVHVLPVADHKDGFLATHSLLAMAISLLRAAGRCLDGPVNREIEEAVLSAAQMSLDHEHRKWLASRFESLAETDTLLLLFDPRLSPAALTIESSAWETAICPVQSTDFRNFAHGRHVWLAQRGENTLILSLTGAETRDVWRDIDELIPLHLRRVQYDYDNCGRFQNFLGILDGLCFVEAMAHARRIDPGKPTVGRFGRAIYEAPSLKDLVSHLTPAVRKKQAETLRTDGSRARFTDTVTGGPTIRDRSKTATFDAMN